MKTCKKCKDEFTPKRSDAKFCSKECKMKYNNDRRNSSNDNYSIDETDNVEYLPDETDNTMTLDGSMKRLNEYETDKSQFIYEDEGDLGGFEMDKIEEEQYETDNYHLTDENEGDLGVYEKDDNHNNIPIKTNHHKKKKKLLRRKKNFQNNLLIGVGLVTILGVSLWKKGKG